MAAMPLSSTPPAFTIHTVETPDDLSAINNLFHAYATALNIDLTFQDFAAELASLPGRYAPPAGVLLLARSPPSSSGSSSSGSSSSPSPSSQALGTPLGCVALRPLSSPSEPSTSTSAIQVCELKRLYVHPAGRGLGVGRALINAALQAARRLDYARVRLDTLPDMTAARALYASLGFVEIGQYYPTPLEGTVFMEMDFSAVKR